METIFGDGTIRIGGAVRPYYCGTRQTGTFCQLMGAGFDLEDYNKLFLEVGINQFYAQEARQKGEVFTPTGRKALSPLENSIFLYSALHAGAKREGQVIDFDVDTVSDWLDAAEVSENPEDMKEVGKVFTTHYSLMTQRLHRQAARPGNAPALTPQGSSQGNQ